MATSQTGMNLDAIALLRYRVLMAIEIASVGFYPTLRLLTAISSEIGPQLRCA